MTQPNGRRNRPSKSTNINQSQRKSVSLDVQIGDRIRQRRAELNLSQADLARRLRITRVQVLKYESGENRLSAARLYQIAEVLGVPIQWFFETSCGPDSDAHVPSEQQMQHDLLKAQKLLPDTAHDGSLSQSRCSPSQM